MLAFLAAFLITLSGARAQTNTEYSFRQQSVADGARYADDDDAPILTMDCLAANGYGQWTLSSATGIAPTGGTTQYQPGWYLLANGLYEPSIKYDASNPAAYPGCYPPGIVQNAALAGGVVPTEPEATANLDGAENFIWPDASRQNFVVQGFRQANVDLSLSFLSNPHPPMNIITSPITPFPAISTMTGTPPTIPHNVVTAAPYRDEFDVCSDASYLYITWCSTTNSSPAGSEIWATVVDINTMAVLPGFPMSMGQGERPTIACDPRNNRYGGATPSFEVAYLTGHTSPSVIEVAKWTSPGPLSVFALTPQFSFNSITYPYLYVTHARILVSSVLSGGVEQPATDAVYAIVDYYEPHPTLAHRKGSTVQTTSEGLGLVEYQQVMPGPPANYVDGMLITPELPVQPDIWEIAPQGWPILDKPIVAISNPYDEQDYAPGSVPFNQFHCLYQYDETPRTGSQPLLIVRGDDNGTSGTTDERLVMTQVYPVPTPAELLPDNPTSYVAAVNQMGIHVHWRTATNVHYYARDLNRTFDEDIDENTLVTDTCTVNDGTAHGGEVGATLLDGLHMSVWTDPNYGADPTDLTGNSGLYQPRQLSTTLDPHVTQIGFDGTDVVLDVWGTLAVMPYFFFNFPDYVNDHGTSVVYPGRGVTIEANATFDYYGLIAAHNTDGSIQTLGGFPQFKAIASPFTNGSADALSGAGNIILKGILSEYDGIYYATLNIHGGADFMLGSGAFLLSNQYGKINVDYEGSIFPLNGSTDSTGHASLHGLVELTGTDVVGNIPADNSEPIMTILGYEANGPSSGGPQFDAEECQFRNTDVNGASEILAEPALKPCLGIVFNNCTFSAANFHYIDPQNLGFYDNGSLTMTTNVFNEQHGRSIFVENTGDPLNSNFEGATMTITGNTFSTINSHIDPDDAAHGTYGIYVKGIDDDYDGSITDMQGDIIVEDNTFNSNNWSTVNPGYPGTKNLEYSAAICFENTTGNIIGNTIKDPAYTEGIWLKGVIPVGYSYTAPPTTRTFLCSNVIRDLHPPDKGSTHNVLEGVRTEYHTGITKLTDIIDCEVGYDATGIGHSFLSFDSIDDYYGAYPHTYDMSHAVLVTSPFGTVGPNYLDLSGIHSSSAGGDDYAGGNAIRATYDDWTTGMMSIGCDAILILGNTYETWNWTQYGQNNMYLCSPGFPLPGSSTQPTVTDAYSIIGQCTTAAALGDVDFNFWGIDGSGNKIDPTNGTGADPENWVLGSTQINAGNISYDWPVANTLGLESNFAGVTCGSSRAVTHHKSELPQSMLKTDSAPSGCQLSFNFGMSLASNYQYEPSYDTLKAFVQRCPTNVNAPGAFGIMSNDVANGGDGPIPQSLPDFQHWLISALAWDPGNADYFCSDVFAIMGTVATGNIDTSWQQMNNETNRGMSVLYWLIHNPLCDAGSGAWELYNNSRGSQEESWFNWPGLDTSKVHLDTTIYSMHDLGLDSVLKYASLLGVHESSMPSILSNASASPNPVREGTEIYFTTNREAYVMVGLFNVLGQQAGSTKFESVVEPGNHEVPLSLAGLPSGTYYARIVTTYGEVQTVKLVKE